MTNRETKEKGCRPCSNIMNMINDLIMLGNFLDDMIEKGMTDLTKEGYNKRCAAHKGIKSAFEESLHLDINALPCTCKGKIQDGKMGGQSPSPNKTMIPCKCPMMKIKKGILNDLRKIVKDKVSTVYKLNKEFLRKEELQRNEKVVALESDDIEEQDISLPYEILKGKLEKIHFKNLKQKKDSMKKLFLGKVPKNMLYCDENSFREEIGQHRVLPKEMKKHFILERAFKNRYTMEEQLYEGFVNATKRVTPCANILSFKCSKHQTKQSIDKGAPKSPKESTEEDDRLYSFPDYIRPPKSAKCDCQRLACRISRLEYLKDILYQVLDSSNSVEQMNLINYANGLLRLMTQEQLEENSLKPISREMRTKAKSDRGSDSEQYSYRVEVRRIKKSPSFERFRQKILHEMHIERRPLSWFKKRCLHFRNKNPKMIFESVNSVVTEERNKELRKAQERKAFIEAITELLELHYSKPYSRLQNADEYVLRKLTMIVKKYLKAEGVNEETNTVIPKKTTAWPCGKAPDRQHPIYNLLQEVKACSKLIEKTFTWKKYEENEEIAEEECTCSTLHDKLLEHSKLVKEVQELFIDAVLFWGSSESIIEKNIREKQETSERASVDGKEQYFKSIDLSKLKINFWKHVTNGEVIESYTRSFEDSWQNSVVNGLFIFNAEIQLLEKERIIIRPQKEKGVKVMSGGRVGQEPLYSEYVAKGMLDCVVLGDKYSGPSVRNILQGMLEIATEEGILIIIMNEHEYRLNFMVAMQQAKELGITTELVLAKDDASYEKYEQRGNGRRGSTGIVLQFKVAGAMAEEGYSLSAISSVCQFMFIASISCYLDESNVYTGSTLEPRTGQLLLKVGFDSPENNKEEKSEKIETERTESCPQDGSSNKGVLPLKQNICLTRDRDENSSSSDTSSKIQLTTSMTDYTLQEVDNISPETDKFLNKLRSNAVKDLTKEKLNKLITGSAVPIEDGDDIASQEKVVEANLELSEVKKCLLEQISQGMLNILFNSDSPHYISPEPGTEVILLLNNQNHTYDHMYTVVKEIADILKELDVKLGRVYVGNFMALPTDGFTITIAKDLDNKLIPFLDKSTTCNHWPPHTSASTFSIQALSKWVSAAQLGACVHPDYVHVIDRVYEQCVQKMKKYRNYYESKDPNLANQINEIVNKFPPKVMFQEIQIDRPYQVLLYLADHFESVDGFGKFLSIFLTSTAQEFNVNPNIFITWRMCCNAFYRGACSLAGYLKYEPGDGTILDVLVPITRACFDTKQGWNPLMYLKCELDKLDEANRLNKEDPGIMFCLMMIKSIHKTLHDFFGRLEWTAWDEKEDKIYVVVSAGKEQKRYGFSTEVIQPEIKEGLKDLEYSEKSNAAQNEIATP